MYENHSQQRRRLKSQNKLSQQMLQHLRYAEKRNDKIRNVEIQEDIHGLIERDNIHNRV